jgi:hypothetical protein
LNLKNLLTRANLDVVRRLVLIRKAQILRALPLRLEETKILGHGVITFDESTPLAWGWMLSFSE